MPQLSDPISAAAPLNPYVGRSPERERPLGGYAVLTGTFQSVTGAFAGWFRRTGRDLPDSVSARHLALLAVATRKASRLVTRDRVPSVLATFFSSELLQIAYARAEKLIAS